MYGLLGEKLGHSFSKEIHESINNYQYNLIEISKDKFDQFMNEKQFNAINVTIPYKEMVIPYLSYIDPKALEIGAVNTIINNNGQLEGYNTDYLGLKSLVIKNNIDFKNKKVLILGTGGTSKTAFVLTKDLGSKIILKVSRKESVDQNIITYEQAQNLYNDCNIIINTTPCGMYPNDDMIIDINKFNNLEAIIDVVYNPLNTKLIREGKKKNIKCINGLYMLVSQAVYASYLFINKKVEERKIDQVYKKIKEQKLNIALIGMPSSGKSTVAQELSKKLNKELIDTDVEIEKKLNKPISSFLTLKTENQFRDIEEKIIDDISKGNNLIISTGGGIINREDNIDRLRRNALIIFIDRPLTLLQATESRPLSSNKKDLEQLYYKRYPIYIKSCDYKVVNDNEIENVIEQIIEVYNENISY